jgi:hypothetical protein
MTGLLRELFLNPVLEHLSNRIWLVLGLTDNGRRDSALALELLEGGNSRALVDLNLAVVFLLRSHLATSIVSGTR